MQRRFFDYGAEQAFVKKLMPPRGLAGVGRFL